MGDETRGIRERRYERVVRRDLTRDFERTLWCEKNRLPQHCRCFYSEMNLFRPWGVRIIYPVLSLHAVSIAFRTNAVRRRFLCCFRGNSFRNDVRHGNICRCKRTQSCVVRATTKPGGWTGSERPIRTRNSTSSKNYNIYSTPRSNVTTPE